VSKPATRDDVVRLLIERFRHRPYLLSVPQTVSAIRRLIKHARLERCGCITWRRARNNDGYGKITFRLGGRPRQLYVHALAELLSANPRAPRHWEEIAHGCNNPPCFSPDHVSRQRRKINRQDSMRNTHRKMAQRRAAKERLAA
jgi:hypothetical protein